MRLLNVHTLQFREFYGNTEPYVVTSHRWSADNEAMLEDIQGGRRTSTTGFKKVQGFAKFVRDYFQHVDWMWIDTCCVNQASDREVSEAVNSMFRWYSQAEACLAYLADVNDTNPFPQSEWFRRGWTLQELLAPRLVLFLSQDWRVIGCKGDRGALPKARLNHTPSMETSVAAITTIPRAVIVDFARSSEYSIDARLKWMDGRETTRAEDMIYSLFGIFDVTLPVIYGEGVDKARRRLLKEISDAKHHEEARPGPSGRSQFNEMDAISRKHENLPLAVFDKCKHWKTEEDRLKYAFVKTAMEKGVTAVQQADYYAAEAHFQEAQDCLNNLHPRQVQKELSFVWVKLAVCAFHVWHTLKAEDALMAVVDLPLAERYLPLDLCEARHLLAQTHVKTGKLDKALNVCRTCYSERCKILKKNHPLCYESLALIARIYEFQGDTKQASRYFELIRVESQDSVQPSLFSTLWPPTQKQWRGYKELTPGNPQKHGPYCQLRAVFSSDGKLFASVTGRGRIKVWDVVSGAEVGQLKSSGKSILDIAISRNGRQVAAATDDLRTWLWNRAVFTGPVVHNSVDDFPLRIAYSSEGNLRVVCRSSGDPGCLVVDLLSGKTLMRAPEFENSTVQTISLDGTLIAYATSDGWIGVWNMTKSSVIFKIKSKERHIEQLKLSGDGTKLASVSYLAIRVWSISAGRELDRLDFVKSILEESSFEIYLSDDCSLVAFRKSEADDEYALREISQNSEMKTLKWRGFAAGTAIAQVLVFSPDDQVLAAINSLGAVAFWDIASLRGRSEDLPLPPGVSSTISKIAGAVNSFASWLKKEAILFYDQVLHPGSSLNQLDKLLERKA